ncbi:MAG: MlaD family protein [Rhodocyclaceae bacterium]|nr:MlaD family protein [Rhodocyclaceae bacterium]
MENRAHAWAAGLFVLLLLAAMAGVFWWFVGRQEPTHTYLLESTGSVVGLNREAQVRFRGIRAGKVYDLYTDPSDPTRLLVEIRIARRFQLTDRTVARLATQGLTGMNYILLEESGAGAGRPLPTDGSARLPLAPSLTETLSKQAAELGERLVMLARRMDRMLSEENIERVGSLLARLDQTSASLVEGSRLLADARAVLAENRGRLATAMTHLEEAASIAPALLGEMRNAGERFVLLEERLAALVERYELLGRRLDEEALAEAQAMLVETRLLATRLQYLVDELGHNPSLLLLGRRQTPGPGEAGFSFPEVER